MRQKAHGQVRRSQVITTYGPGALIDLPQESAIVAGLDEWPPPHKLDEIDEPRLARKLQAITGGRYGAAAGAAGGVVRPGGDADRHRCLALSGVVHRPGRGWGRGNGAYALAAPRAPEGAR